MKSNYHTHLATCGHAVGMSEDYVKEAIKDGYDILGISEHGPISHDMMHNDDYYYRWVERQMSRGDFDNIFLPDVNNAIKKYGDKIKIYKGLEIEYLPQYHDYFKKLRESLDYMILGMHFFDLGDKTINSYEEMTKDNVIEYAKVAKLAFETGMYCYMSHPDLFMYRYPKWDEECEKASRLIIEEAIKHNIYLEINVGGIKETLADGKEVGQGVYPRDEFWQIASEYKDLKVVIGADAHDPKELNYKPIELAYEFAKKHHIRVLEYIPEIK